MRRDTVLTRRTKSQLSAATTAEQVRVDNKKTQKAVASARLFIDERAALLRRVRDQLAAAQDKQSSTLTGMAERTTNRLVSVTKCY